MKLLLDTHAFYWFAVKPEALRPALHEQLLSPAQDVFVSAATGYEIEFKANLGKLGWAGTVSDAVQTAGFAPLPITPAHAEQAARLPLHHRDPFDRLLIAQAQFEGMTLVSNDAAMAAYAVTCLGC